jgi:hypothetical protein
MLRRPIEFTAYYRTLPKNSLEFHINDINSSTWEAALKVHEKPDGSRQWISLYCCDTILYDAMRLCGGLA